ncbi:MAG: radical SAM protein [Syntrophomonadaceae bacterium]|nr:radical SAM protein [Syntrophomonadaceae bacterium]
MNENIILREIICRSALNKTGIPGYQYCINPYVGCAHNCVYCYASFMCRFAGHQEKWGDFLDVKVNLPDVLAKQLSSRKRKEGKVLLGSVTDVYQPAEISYKITHASLNILAGYQYLDVHILTKSALVLRDLPILRQLPACEVGFTISTLDRNIAQVMEPGASPPQIRIAAAQQLIKAGIPVWVFIAPLLPGLTDTEESLTLLLTTLRKSGIRTILVDFLNPYSAVTRRLRNTYSQHFPKALPAFEDYLAHMGIYRDRIKCRLDQISKYVGCNPCLV